MRNILKIKASFIFLAWLMIFAHGLIPHNHYEDVPFHHEFHNKGCIAESSSILIKSHSGDEKGCRISNFIFHKFSQDEQEYTVNYRISGYFLIPSAQVIYNDHYAFLSGRFTDSQSLRAPPRA